jgi:hypothetical protein
LLDCAVTEHENLNEVHGLSRAIQRTSTKGTASAVP